MEKDVNKLIDDVISKVPDYLPTLYKIRFVYLEVGKFLTKDVDFFFSIDHKLRELNLSEEEIKRIYEDEKDFGDTKIICRSSAIILKKIYDRLGIKSRLIKSNNNFMALKKNGEEFFKIHHWILAVQDEKNTYFLTITPDLPYIQMGMMTKHFGSHVPYIQEIAGEKIQIYDGPKIRHTVLSKEQLFEIDTYLGYINTYFNYDYDNHLTDKYHLNYYNTSFNMVKDAMSNNKFFCEIEQEETSFYKELVEFEGVSGRKISFAYNTRDDISDDDWEVWIKILCEKVLNKISEIIGYDPMLNQSINDIDWNYELWLKELCISLEEYILLYLNKGRKDDFQSFYVGNDFNFSKWSRKIKKNFSNETKDLYQYDNILIILDKMNTLVNFAKKGGNKRFREVFSSLNYHFINPKNLIENNIDSSNGISNYYIANKFSKVFKRLFSCNEGTTEVNQMGYNEQVVIIKEMLRYMFPELTGVMMSNNPGMEFDPSKYILDKIHFYPLKNKITGEYALVFNVLGDTQKGDIYFIYDMKSNEFKAVDIFSLSDQYVVISNRMLSRMDEIEDIEEIDDLPEDDIMALK